MSLKVESTGLIQDGSPIISEIQIPVSQKGHFPRLPGPTFLEVTIEPPIPTNLKVLKSLLLEDLLKASSMPGSVEWGLLYNTPWLWSSSVSGNSSNLISHHHLAGQPLSPASQGGPRLTSKGSLFPAQPCCELIVGTAAWKHLHRLLICY